jgi:hypothetical protein
MLAQRALDAGADPIQVSWQHAITGEIALSQRRFDDAESAFRASEYHIASSFAIYPTLVALVNNLPFRDGLARTAAARGDLRRAVDLYRQLNQPDVTSKWTSVFEPRYTRSAAELAAKPVMRRWAAPSAPAFWRSGKGRRSPAGPFIRVMLPAYSDFRYSTRYVFCRSVSSRLNSAS